MGASRALPLLRGCSRGLPACSGAQTRTHTCALLRLVGPSSRQEAALCVCA